MSHRVRIVALLLPVLAAACGGPTETPPARPIAGISVADPLPPYAYVGDTLAPSVRVYDADNRPFAGVRVNFASARGTTALQSTSATTDATGIARAGEWRLPTRPALDTLVVTVPRATHVPPLRVQLEVRAGPVARWVTLAPASGEGTVLQSMVAGPAFQAFDAYDNPMGFVNAAVESTPDNGGARVATALLADAEGRFALGEWTPRVLGTHTLRLVPSDGGVASPTITRVVRQPACAAAAAIPDAAAQTEHTGTLGVDASAPCADTVDVWALGSARARVLQLSATSASNGAGIPLRVSRAGASDASGIVVTPRARTSLAVPAGEYVVAVGAGGVANGTSYRLRVFDWTENILSSDTTWIVQGASAPGIATGEVSAEGTGAARAEGKIFVVPMRGAGSRRLVLTVDASAGWDPILAAYGRSDAAPSPVALALASGAGSRRTLTVDVPAGYDEALVLVGQALPLVSRTPTFTLRVE